MEWVLVNFVGISCVFASYRLLRLRVSSAEAILSPFFYFALIWYVAFPLKSALLVTGLSQGQAPYSFTDRELLQSTLLSFLFLALVVAGVWSGGGRNMSNSNAAGDMAENFSVARGALVSLLLAACALFFLKDVFLSGGQWTSFVGNEQNEARVGHGPLFLLAELFVFGFIALAGVGLVRKERSVNLLLSIAALGFFPLAAIMTVAISSRRIIAAFVFSVAIVLIVRGVRKFSSNAWLSAAALCLLLSTVVASPALQIFRYMWSHPVTYSDQAAQTATADSGPESATEYYTKFFFTTVGSTFEGADHLASFIEKSTATQFWLGVDGGKAWLYNMGLALVPRSVWAGKPLIYGNVAEQDFLYPSTHEKGAAAITLPPSFIVDFIYGLGLPVALLLSFFLGRFLAVMGRWLWHSDGVANRAIALFVLVNIFNLVRSGTGFVQGLVIFLVILGSFVGWKRIYYACKQMSVEVFDVRDQIKGALAVKNH